MELRNMLIMLVVISVVTVGSSFILYEFNHTYGGEANITKFSNTFDKFDDAYSTYNTTRDLSLAGGSLDEQVGFYSFSKNMWAGIKQLITAPEVLHTIFSDFLNDYGLGWAVIPLYTIIVITVLFSLISFFWRWWL